MLISDVMACSFDSWYEKFKQFTSESLLFPLEKDFLKYLLEDGIIMPKTSRNECRCDSPNSDTSSSTFSDEGETTEQPEFKELESKIESAIKLLGGSVFPKLNWSAPKDASWMLCGNTIKCSSFTDIYLLLKSSDFVLHDLTAPFSLCDDLPVNELGRQPDMFQPTLVLRRWTDYRPDCEFRCFIRNHELIAITQRIHDAYFDSVVQNAECIKRALCEFLRQHILRRFSIANYTVDLYYEPPSGCCSSTSARSSPHDSDKVVIIDFNVFGPPTEAFLFTWSELEDIESTTPDNEPVFRFQNDRSIRPSTLSSYALPTDLIDIATGSDPNKVMDYVQACVEEQQRLKA